MVAEDVTTVPAHGPPWNVTITRSGALLVDMEGLLAGVMILISVFSYARSDTRKTIEQIQANNHLIQQQDSTTLTKNGDVNAESVNEIEKSITKDIQSHDDEADFSPDELTDSALGL